MKPTIIQNMSDQLQMADFPVPICCEAMVEGKFVGGTGEVPMWMCPGCGHMQRSGSKLRKPLVGSFTLQLIDPTTMEVVEERVATNVFTDVGRNYIAHSMSYSTFVTAPGADEPATSKRRYDGVRYMMVGIGTQLETNAVTKLHTPTPFNGAGEYLAQVVAPNELPGTGISALWQRTYGVNELSVSGPVTVTEAGLFPNGIAGSPLTTTDQNVPPLAYKVFEPVTKTNDFLLSLRWEIKP